MSMAPIAILAWFEPQLQPESPSLQVRIQPI
jgi:hypothetical protein